MGLSLADPPLIFCLFGHLVPTLCDLARRFLALAE